MDWWNRRVDERLAYQERLDEAKEKKAQAKISRIEAQANLVSQEAESIQAKVR